MCVWRRTSLFAAPARQTVIETARVAWPLKFALDQHHSYLDPSRVSTSNLSISGCSQTSIPSNSCAMMSMMLTTAPSGCPCPDVCSCPHRASPRPCRCHWKLPSAQRRGQKFRSLLARQRSLRWPSRIHALRYHVWMSRSSDLWIDGNSGHDFFLSHSRSARQLSRSRSIADVHVQAVKQLREQEHSG